MSDQEIMTSGERLPEQAPARSAGQITAADRLSLLREAMTNPDVQPEKAIAMAELMFKVEDREKIAEFNKDLSRAIQEMPAIYKRGQSNKHRYAKFEDLHRAVMPVLSRNNLTIKFKIDSDGPMVTCQAVIHHDNGHIDFGGIMKAPPDKGPGRNDVQAVPSTATLLKRHTMKAALNIIEDGEDDDGVGGRPDDQRNDRQERLVLDGQDAAEAGNYPEWYQRQAPRDRAWLISTGNHARFGGALDMIAQRKGPEPTPEKSAGVAKAERTPEEMTEAYIAGLASKVSTLDQLVVYQEKAAGFMSKLKASHPDLHKKCLEANSARFSDFDMSGEDEPEPDQGEDIKEDKKPDADPEPESKDQESGQRTLV